VGEVITHLGQFGGDNAFVHYDALLSGAPSEEFKLGLEPGLFLFFFQ
jgi:hypothetical protein